MFIHGDIYQLMIILGQHGLSPYHVHSTKNLMMRFCFSKEHGEIMVIALPFSSSCPALHDEFWDDPMDGPISRDTQ